MLCNYGVKRSQHMHKSVLDIRTTVMVMFPLFELHELLVFEKQSSEMNQNPI